MHSYELAAALEGVPGIHVTAERGRLLVHVPDARDPDAVRRAQLESYETRQARVFP
jgi:multicomponent Na+:H+ antiporter subunit E